MEERRPSETEQQLLLVTWRLGEGAYGVTVRDELARLTGRMLAVGAIYSTLIRLERKGWVRSWIADPTPVRGGKAKRYFAITASGEEAVGRARASMDRLWAGLERAPTAGEGA